MLCAYLKWLQAYLDASVWHRFVFRVWQLCAVGVHFLFAWFAWDLDRLNACEEATASTTIGKGILQNQGPSI